MNEPLPYAIETAAYRIKDMPARLRPREEMERVGARNVSDETLLAVLIGCGRRGLNAVDLARRLIRTHGSLTAIASLSPKELRSRHMRTGIGPVRALTLAAALELAKRLSEEAAPRRCSVRTPEDAANLLRQQAKTLDAEVFWVLLLDAKNNLRAAPVEVSRGLLDSSLVHPREVFKRAIADACAAVVLVHNHPSGDPLPSAEDIRITKQLAAAGKIVGIRVLDHVIVGRSSAERAQDFVSLRESGLVDFAG